MKTIITILLLAPLSLMAQTKPTSVKANVVPIKKVEVIKEKPVSPIKIIDKKVNPLELRTDPEFPGGMAALDKHVKSNFKISRKDRKNEVEGEIQVKFTIMADGTLANVKVLNGGMSEKLNKEALKVIIKLPNWTAGTSNGNAVDVMYVYSIKIGK
jgi:TonB family protein